MPQNDFFSVFFLLFLFGQSMIGFAFLLASLQDSSAITATTGFIIWVISASIFSSVGDVYDNGENVTVANIISLYSPFVFSKGMYDLSIAAFTGNGRSFSDRTNKDISELFWLEKVYLYLILDTVLYMVIGFYISMVFPGEYGVPKKFYFFVQPSYWTGKPSKSAAKRRTRYTPEAVVNDSDVVEEEKKVKAGLYPPNTCVVIEDLMKVYRSGICGSFTAVKGISLCMQNDQLFCLLGPNGAGKTTTFNMLSGILPSSAGDVTIFGNSIVTEMDQIRKIMGVCPQHDLLWDEMTGKEHLEFFCRFKGVPKELVQKEAMHRLEMVGMTSVANVPASAYSGGEKRRLSVALATVGNPKIIFMDEPTTGMDPVSRHQVWNVISEAKKGRIIILTTHSMEEADVLSDRIGIVAHGQLRCLGTNIHLKNKFGSGFQLTMLFSPAKAVETVEAIQRFVDKNLPEWAPVFSTGTLAPQSFSVIIPYSEGPNVAALLKVLEEHTPSLGVDEITMNLSSLEEVFIKIAKESQKETTVSLEEIEASTQELNILAEATKGIAGKKPPFFHQVNALARKHAAFYKRSWLTLVIQFFLPLLFILVMFLLADDVSASYRNDPHPPLLPPPAPFSSSEDPIRFTIPYFSASPLGSCCNETTSGFLSDFSFEVLNSSLYKEVVPFTLGAFPTSDFEFEYYSSRDALFDMLYDTSATGWITAYTFDELDLSRNSFRIGYMKNVTASGTRGSLAGIALVDNAVLRAATSANELVVRVKMFPTWEHKVTLSSGSEPAWVLLGCSFFMVTILTLIVREKQERLRNLMVMTGMRMRAYWSVLAVLGILVYFVIVLWWIGLGCILQMEAFLNITFLGLILTYFVFAFNQVGFAFLLSSFCDYASTAALGGYVYILFFVILTQSIVSLIVDLASDANYYGVAIFPHFGLALAYTNMQTYYYNSGETMSWSEFGGRTAGAVVITFGMGVVFFILHQYFEEVFPSEYGNKKRPWFLFQKSFWKGSRSETPKPLSLPLWCPTGLVGDQPPEAYSDPEDVSAERRAAREAFDSAFTKFSVAVPGISKSFGGMFEVKKMAVSNMPLLVNHLECFGLLGPNGGGKTTLVNILSGLYPITSGDGKIHNKSVVAELAAAQRHMGVCPQDSVLWSELSAREHLNLFGRLRNLRGEQLKSAVNLALKQVLLTDAADRPAGGYSGGMKRRLSLAIALIGCPSVVLLDEPTTGVDPFSRHVVWETIRAYQRFCTIVLITHNMEEADVLCERVGMMNKGRMVCVGKPHELKTRFNVGYKLIVLHQNPSSEEITDLVRSVVHDAEQIDAVPGSCEYELPKSSTKLSLLFSAFQHESQKLKITDWALLPSNLEDVLLKSIQKCGVDL